MVAAFWFLRWGREVRMMTRQKCHMRRDNEDGYIGALVDSVSIDWKRLFNLGCAEIE
jgi:hypothetical protein